MKAALLQRTLMWQFASVATLTARATCSALDTSHWRNVASPPALQIAAAVASPAVLSRSAMKTEASSAAKSSAIARPIPFAPPVTMAVLFLSRIMSLIYQRHSFTSRFCARNCSAGKIGHVQFVKILAAESHICRASKENRPAIPGEQGFLALGIDPPNFI